MGTVSETELWATRRVVVDGKASLSEEKRGGRRRGFQFQSLASMAMPMWKQRRRTTLVISLKLKKTCVTVLANSQQLPRCLTCTLMLSRNNSLIKSLSAKKMLYYFRYKFHYYIFSHCCIAKSHRLPSSPSLTEYSTTFELIYTDCWGPSPFLSSTGYR